MCFAVREEDGLVLTRDDDSMTDSMSSQCVCVVACWAPLDPEAVQLVDLRRLRPVIHHQDDHCSSQGSARPPTVTSASLSSRA